MLLHHQRNTAAVLLSINEVVLTLLIVPRVLVATLLLALPGIVLVHDLLGDTVEQLLGVYPEQLPSLVERVEDGTLLVRALRDESLLKLLQELERKLVFT